MQYFFYKIITKYDKANNKNKLNLTILNQLKCAQYWFPMNNECTD